MNRKKFMGSLLGLVGVATSAKELVKLAPKSVVADVPGIDSVPFTVKLTKDWFRQGDILIRGGVSNQDFGKLYRCTGDKLVLVTGKGSERKEYNVEWIEDDGKVHPGWVKMHSQVGEFDTELPKIVRNVRDI